MGLVGGGAGGSDQDSHLWGGVGKRRFALVVRLVSSNLFDPSTYYILGPIGARDQTQITADHNHTVKVRIGEKEKEKR
jgi:hypothetical protein